MCIDCAGIHRNLGVHISVVKSVTLDKWQPKWIHTVSTIGNRVSNNYYEYVVFRLRSLLLWCIIFCASWGRRKTSLPRDLQRRDSALDTRNDVMTSLLR